jgi:hypothetical protein
MYAAHLPTGASLIPNLSVRTSRLLSIPIMNGKPPSMRLASSLIHCWTVVDTWIQSGLSFLIHNHKGPGTSFSSRTSFVISLPHTQVRHSLISSAFLARLTESGRNAVKALASMLCQAYLSSRGAAQPGYTEGLILISGAPGSRIHLNKNTLGPHRTFPASTAGPASPQSRQQWGRWPF